MKALIGFVLIIAGIAFGVWAGVWWAFIGGIVDVIEQVRAPELSALAVATGLAKVMFAGVIGYVAGAVVILPGYLMLND